MADDLTEYDSALTGPVLTSGQCRAIAALYVARG